MVLINLFLKGFLFWVLNKSKKEIYLSVAEFYNWSGKNGNICK